MFIKLLTFSGIWIAFGFAAGCAIWAGMVIARSRTGHAGEEASSPESANDLTAKRRDGGVTYRVIKGGREGTDQGETGPAHRQKDGRKLLNFPR